MDNDDKPDKFYNTSSKNYINIEVQDNGYIKLDIDEDGEWDHVYNPLSGEVIQYKESKKKDSEEFPLIIVLSVILVVAIIIVVFLYLIGYIRIEKDK